MKFSVPLMPQLKEYYYLFGDKFMVEPSQIEQDLQTWQYSSRENSYYHFNMEFNYHF